MKINPAKVVFCTLIGLSHLMADSYGGYDCDNPDPKDKLAVCTCKCYNDYKKKLLGNPTCAPCIGAAKQILSSCVSSCTLKYSNESAGGSGDDPWGDDLDKVKRRVK